MNRTDYLIQFTKDDELLPVESSKVYSAANELARILVEELPANNLCDLALKKLDEVKSLAVLSWIKGHSHDG